MLDYQAITSKMHYSKESRHETSCGDEIEEAVLVNPTGKLLYSKLLRDSVSYFVRNNLHLSGIITLGTLKPNIDGHSAIVCISRVLNNFIKNLALAALSVQCRSVQLPVYLICIKTCLLAIFCSKLMGVESGERMFILY